MCSYNTKEKTPLNNGYLNNEGQERKTVHTKERAIKGGGVKKVNMGIWVIYFLYKSEYRISKPVEITIKKRTKVDSRKWRG
jgi:hypothetical protein